MARELAEEDQLTERRDGRERIPLDMKEAAWGVHHQRDVGRCVSRRLTAGKGFTLWVKFTGAICRTMLHSINRLHPNANLPTAGFRFNASSFMTSHTRSMMER